MLKKKKMLDRLISVTIGVVFGALYQNLVGSNSTLNYFCGNIFRISHKKKQFMFAFVSMLSASFITLSTGMVLAQYVNRFKFFKKSKHNINPLIFRLVSKYREPLSSLYLLENKNYTKKSLIFLKKLYSNNFITPKHVVYSKT